MKIRTAIAVCMAMALGVTAASAAPLPPNSLDTDEKAWFYNRPGATHAEALADLEACLAFGSAAAPRASGAGAAYGLIGALVGVVVAEMMSKGPARAISDDCMISLGYRRYDTTDENMAAFTARFTRMDADARAALMGGETPPDGVLARQWVNSYWLRKDGDAPEQAFRGRVGRPMPMKFVPSTNIKPVETGAAIAPKPNEAVVVATIRYEGEGNVRPLLSFTRDNRQTGQADPTPIGPRQHSRWAVFNVRAAKPSDVPAGGATRQVFVIPSGFYGLASASAGLAYSNFCLGTVGFEAAPGAVIDLGEIVVRRGSGEVNPLAPTSAFQLRIGAGNAEASRASLARAPDLAARLAPVALHNGFSRGCTIMGTVAPIAYGFDVPGAAWLNAPAPVVTPVATSAAAPLEPAAAAPAEAAPDAVASTATEATPAETP